MRHVVGEGPLGHEGRSVEEGCGLDCGVTCAPGSTAHGGWKSRHWARGTLWESSELRSPEQTAHTSGAQAGSLSFRKQRDGWMTPAWQRWRGAAVAPVTASPEPGSQRLFLNDDQLGRRRPAVYFRKKQERLCVLGELAAPLMRTGLESFCLRVSPWNVLVTSLFVWEVF